MAEIMNIEDYRSDKSATIERLRQELESEKRKNYFMSSENQMLIEEVDRLKKDFGLNDPEASELTRLSQSWGTSKQAIIRSAFRLYQTVHELMKSQNVHSIAEIKWPDIKSML